MKRTLLPAGLIGLAVGWVFLPVRHGGWLWDDSLEITQNPFLRDASGLGKIWFSRASMDYFPLKGSVQWAAWHLWGDGPAGYHLLNIALHFLSALLFWRLLVVLRRPSPSSPASAAPAGIEWLGGLLFAVHPVAVESVAWISELKNTLSLPLLLGAMLAYLAYDERWSALPPTRLAVDGVEPARWGQRAPPYLLALLLFLLAMLSKSSVVMFPVVLLLHAWWKRGRIGRRDLLSSLPFFVLSLVLGLVTVWFQHHRAMPGEGALHDYGWSARVAGAGLAVAFYFSKCVWPAGLSPVYPRWALDPPAPSQFLPWLGLAVLLVWLWTRRAGWGRTALFGLGFFLLNLVPVLGFVPMAYQRVAWVADHFAYLPLLGLIGLAVAAFGRAHAWCRVRGWAGLSVAGAALLALGLAIESRTYAENFRGEEVLWTRALQVSPDAWVARNGLGKVYLEQGKLPEAAAEFERTARLEPDSAEVRVNLGNAWMGLDRVGEAIGQYEAAVRIDPALAGARYDLGRALLQAGQPAAAAGQLAAAVRIDPGYAAAHNNLGLALARTDRLAEAMAHYETALRLKPDFPEAQLNLGNAFFLEKNPAEAIEHYRQALRIDPRYAPARRNLIYALRSLHRDDEAKAESAQAASFEARP